MTIDLLPGRELSVALKRNSRVSVTFTLNWRVEQGTLEPTDLDIGCLYRSHDRRIGVGAVQTVKPLVTSAADEVRADAAPLIKLESSRIAIDADDQDGSTPHGETLTMLYPSEVEFAIVFASIYQGMSDFRRVGAELTIAITNAEPAVIRLANPDPGLRWCAMVACGAKDREFVVVPEERYFLSGLHADRHYGFGLDWVVGLKERVHARS